MMQQSSSTLAWEDLRRAARTAERHLEDKIAAYTAISKAATRVAVDYDVGTSSSQLCVRASVCAHVCAAPSVFA